MSDEILASYIQRVMTLKAQLDRQLSAEDLADIAQQLGLSEHDLQAVQRAADAAFSRGNGFAEHERWDDAIREYQTFIAVRPNAVPALYALANAHARRFALNNHPTDRQQAIALARRSLELDPEHKPSYALLNQLDPPTQRPMGSPRVAALAIGLALCGGFMLFHAQRFLPTGEQASPDTRSSPLLPPSPHNSAFGLTLEGQQQGLVLDARYVEHQVYANAAYVQLGVMVTNRGKTELDEVKARLEQLDAAGQVVSQDPLNLQEAYQPPLRPGDRRYLNTTVKSSAGAARGRVVVTSRREEPAPAHYPPARQVMFQWDVPSMKPPLGLQIRERGMAVVHGLGDDVYVKPVFEVYNGSRLTLRKLKLRLKLLAADNRELRRNEHMVVWGQGGALRPDETAIDGWNESIGSQFDHYALSAVEAE